MNLVWKDNKTVTGILRLAIFVLISCSVHLLVLQVGVSRQADLKRKQQQGVGYVSRSVHEFVERAEKLAERD